MNLKKEVRLLLIDEIEGHIVAVVIRGCAGVEGAIVFEDCSKLREALRSRKGLLAEVSYVVDTDVCGDLGLKSISLGAINNRDIAEAVKEAKRVLSLTKLRFIQLKVKNTAGLNLDSTVA